MHEHHSPFYLCHPLTTRLSPSQRPVVPWLSVQRGGASHHQQLLARLLSSPATSPPLSTSPARPAGLQRASFIRYDSASLQLPSHLPDSDPDSIERNTSSSPPASIAVGLASASAATESSSWHFGKSYLLLVRALASSRSETGTFTWLCPGELERRSWRLWTSDGDERLTESLRDRLLLRTQIQCKPPACVQEVDCACTLLETA